MIHKVTLNILNCEFFLNQSKEVRKFESVSSGYSYFLSLNGLTELKNYLEMLLGGTDIYLYVNINRDLSHSEDMTINVKSLYKF